MKLITEQLNAVIEYGKYYDFPLQGTQKENRQFACLLVRKLGPVKVRVLIDLVVKSYSEKYAPSISDFKQLYYKYGDLVLYYKKNSVNNSNNNITEC